MNVYNSFFFHKIYYFCDEKQKQLKLTNIILNNNMHKVCLLHFYLFLWLALLDNYENLHNFKTLIIRCIAIRVCEIW